MGNGPAEKHFELDFDGEAPIELPPDGSEVLGVSAHTVDDAELQVWIDAVLQQARATGHETVRLCGSHDVDNHTWTISSKIAA